MYLGEKGIANTENAEVLKAALHTAKQEMRMGTTMSCIKMRTGWELGVEGLWKFEYYCCPIKVRKGIPRGLNRRIEAVELSDFAFQAPLVK